MNQPKLLEDLGRLFPTEKSKQKKRYGLYLCECGNEFKAASYKVKIGHTKSCGCLQKEVASKTHRKHGLRNHPLNGIWRGIQQRCTNSNRKSYKNYGDCGVHMCKEWSEDFQKFYDWSMENGYKEGLQLDKDILCEANDIHPKVYGPDTCMWLTPKENNPINARKEVERLKQENQYINQMEN